LDANDKVPILAAIMSKDINVIWIDFLTISCLLLKTKIIDLRKFSKSENVSPYIL